MSAALPLPRGFFETNVHISDDARRQFIEHAEAALRQVFALGGDAQRSAWLPVREKKGVSVFRTFSRASTTVAVAAHQSNVAEVSGKATLHASLPEIARAYAAHDDALFRRLMKKLDSNVLDAAVLSTIVPRSLEAPFRFIGVKWFAVKTPTLLVAQRDYCVLEVQDRIEDAYGNAMFVRVLASIDVPQCPSLERSHALVRANVLSGALYRVDRAEPHLVRVHLIMRNDPSGYFPAQWAYKTAEATLIQHITQLQRIVEKHQMRHCRFKSRTEWVPNAARPNCIVCCRAFTAFRLRHHCRSCGDVICTKCSVFKRVDVPGTKALKTVRLCTECNLRVQRNASRSDDTEQSSRSDDRSDGRSDVVDLAMLAGTTGTNNSSPNTPSAYSSASSTASDLSFQSTTSTRSVVDRRGRGWSAAPRTPLPRTGSQRGGFYDVATPRSYVANHLFGGTSTSNSSCSDAMTPRSDISDVSVTSRTPLHAAQRMTSFRQQPLDLAYLRDSVASSCSSVVSAVEDSSRSVAAPADAIAGCEDAIATLELSAISTASALSSSTISALFADGNEAVVGIGGRSRRAMTFEPHVVRESTESDSNASVSTTASGRRSTASRTRKSDTTNSIARRPFFSTLFSRSASAALSGRTMTSASATAAVDRTAASTTVESTSSSSSTHTSDAAA